MCPFFGSSLGGSRRARLGLSARWSRGLGPTEQHRHLRIGHSLLLSDAHGLTQVDGQDVLAQQTLVSEEDGVGEGRTRAVVTGDKDGVQKKTTTQPRRQTAERKQSVVGRPGVTVTDAPSDFCVV